MSGQNLKNGRRGPARRGNGLLTAFAACTGLLAMIKRIPLTNMIGDNGNAYFGMAYDTYMFFFLFCGYYMQPVVARMMAARSSKGQYRNTRRVWKAALIGTLLLGGVGTVLMVLLADGIADGLFRTGLSSVALKLFAPAVLLMSLLGLMRGYFQGMGTMVPTALSRFVEEASAFLAVLFLVPSLAGYGKKVGAILIDSKYEQAFGAAGGALAFVIGAGLSFLFLLVIYAMFQGSFRRRERKEAGKGTEGYQRITHALVLSAIPVILTGFTMYGSYIIDQVLFLRLMPKSPDTVVAWGIYTGKYRILAGMPVAAVTFLCASMIPAVSVSAASRNGSRLREKTFVLIKSALIVSLPLAVYFAVMSESLMQTLFTVGDTALAAKLLRIGSIAIVLQALGIALSAALQGMERERNLLVNSAAALAVHLILIFLLVGSAKLEVVGVLYAVIGLYAVMLILNFISVARIISLRTDWGRLIGIPVIAAGVSGLVLFILNSLLAEKAAGGVLCVLGLVVGMLIYFILLLALHGVTERELKQVPGGGILVFVGRALRFL